MKALSLTQPWATLVAIGAKKIETRSWHTDYRGPLAIHAATKMPRKDLERVFTSPHSRVLDAAGYETLGSFPRGALVAVCFLTDVIETMKVEGDVSEQELAFGDFSPGRWAWMLDDVRPLDTPVQYKGALSLWEVPDEVVYLEGGVSIPNFPPVL